MVDLPDFDPAAIRFKTNYGATSMLANINKQQRGVQKSSSSLIGLMGTMNKLQNQSNDARSRAFNAPTGMGAPRRKHHGGPPLKGSNNLKLDALEHAIGGQESGWGFGARNPSSGAAGYSQILPGNFTGKGGWDVEALGHNISLHKFMTHPRLQRKITRNKLNEYLKHYGLRGATQAWYGGPGAVGNNNISGGSGYPSTGEYADQVMQQIRHYIKRHRR